MKSKKVMQKVAIFFVCSSHILFTITSQNLEADIAKWMEKYDRDLEDKSNELLRLQAKRAIEYKQLEDLASLVCFKIKID
jgi:hypothetical protein